MRKTTTCIAGIMAVAVALATLAFLSAPAKADAAAAEATFKAKCAMCHGPDGKGETAKDMKLTMADFTDPATLKDHTDGEIFYIIKNGHNAAEEKPPQ